MEYSMKTMQGKRELIEVIIYTQSYKIVGSIHAMPASRIVDFMNSKREDFFIVVTNANVYTLPDEKLLQAADFFAINRKAIMMVFPKLPGAPILPGKQSSGKAP
jgi:hypothetical protein